MKKYIKYTLLFFVIYGAQAKQKEIKFKYEDGHKKETVIAKRGLDPNIQVLVEAMVDEIINEGHPELTSKEINLSYYRIDNNEVFFVSNFKASRIFRGAHDYRIGVNPKVFTHWDIGRDALKGVLAHELMHTVNYFKGSLFGTLLPAGVNSIHCALTPKFERKIDIQTVLRGYGPHLIQYKKWQYPKLSEEGLKRKKKKYLTPPEIEYLMSVMDEVPDLVAKWSHKKAPFNLLQFKHSYEYWKQYGKFKVDRKVGRR